ncbi:hypothetical protein B0H14DRAFT_2604945 [Mycena olivaceomarginata]|nr:hypothetical protein B0H14DRAFT_2604945 [Mycena olivaceomarginata]
MVRYQEVQLNKHVFFSDTSTRGSAPRIFSTFPSASDIPFDEKGVEIDLATDITKLTTQTEVLKKRIENGYREASSPRAADPPQKQFVGAKTFSRRRIGTSGEMPAYIYCSSLSQLPEDQSSAHIPIFCVGSCDYLSLSHFLPAAPLVFSSKEETSIPALHKYIQLIGESHNLTDGIDVLRGGSPCRSSVGSSRRRTSSASCRRGQGVALLCTSSALASSGVRWDFSVNSTSVGAMRRERIPSRNKYIFGGKVVHIGKLPLALRTPTIATSRRMRNRDQVPPWGQDWVQANLTPSGSGCRLRLKLVVVRQNASTDITAEKPRRYFLGGSLGDPR